MLGVTGDACIGCPGGRGTVASGVVGASDSCNGVNPDVDDAASLAGACGARLAVAHGGAHD